MKKILLILLLFIFIPILFAGASDYVLMEPSITDNQQPADFIDYLQSIYKLMFWVIAMVAVIMIVVGGIQYMGSDRLKNKAEGKDRIWKAIWGLLTVLLAWLIVYSINPDLVSLKIDFSSFSLNRSGSGSTAGLRTNTGIIDNSGQSNNGGTTTNGSASNLTDQEVRDRLSAAGIEVKAENTSVAGLQPTTIDWIIDQKNQCPECGFVITGGTEAGHSSNHTNGYKIDLRSNDSTNTYLNNLIKEDFNSAGQVGNYAKYVSTDGQIVILNELSNPKGAHWDIFVKGN